MSEKLRKFELNTFYYLAIHCIFCGHKVVGHEEDEQREPNPCKHTLFVAHDEGFEYLSERAAQQLRERGFEVEIAKDDGLIFVEPPEEEEDLIAPDFITDALEFRDGLKVAEYAGPPALFGFYVGFAPTDDE